MKDEQFEKWHRNETFQGLPLEGVARTAWNASREAHANPWRPIAEVPRDGRMIEYWFDDRISIFTADRDRGYDRSVTHWRNHVPPEPVKDDVELAWESSNGDIGSTVIGPPTYRAAVEHFLKWKKGGKE